MNLVISGSVELIVSRETATHLLYLHRVTFSSRQKA